MNHENLYEVSEEELLERHVGSCHVHSLKRWMLLLRTLSSKARWELTMPRSI